MGSNCEATDLEVAPQDVSANKAAISCRDSKNSQSQRAKKHANASSAAQLSWRVGAYPVKRTSRLDDISKATSVQRETPPQQARPSAPSTEVPHPSRTNGRALHLHESAPREDHEHEVRSRNGKVVQNIATQNSTHTYYLTLYLSESILRPGKSPGWSLDPFCPFETKSEERTLFQHYLNSVPPLLYGCRIDSLFNPVKEISMPCGYMFYSQFRWMLISAQHMVSSQTKNAWPASMYKHHVEAYRELNDDLADPERRYSFDTMINLTCAVHTEFRTSGPAKAKLHLKALERIRAGRRGRFIAQSGPVFAVIRACSYTTYLLSECELDTIQELDNAKSVCLDKIRQIQFGTQELARHPMSACSRRSLSFASKGMSVTAFKQARLKFLRNSHIQKVLKTPPNALLYQHIASLFSVLLFIHISLHDLGVHLAPMFLDRTVELIESSALTDPNTGASMYKLPALCMIVARVVVDIMQSQPGYDFRLDENGEDESSHLRGVVIEGLKLFSYLSPNNRMRLVVVMMGWLMDDQIFECEAQLDTSWFSEQDFDAFSTDAVRNWELEQQIRRQRPV